MSLNKDAIGIRSEKLKPVAEGTGCIKPQFLLLQEFPSPEFIAMGRKIMFSVLIPPIPPSAANSHSYCEESRGNTGKKSLGKEKSRKWVVS